MEEEIHQVNISAELEEALGIIDQNSDRGTESKADLKE